MIRVEAVRVLLRIRLMEGLVRLSRLRGVYDTEFWGGIAGIAHNYASCERLVL